MRAWTRRWVLPVVVLGLAAMPIVPCAAAAEDYNDEIGILFGASRPDRDYVGDDRENAIRVVGGLRYAHLFEDTAVLFVDATAVRYDGDLDGSTPPGRVLPLPNVGDVLKYGARIGLERVFNPGKTARFFVSGGLGWLWYRPTEAGKFDAPMASLGFGQRIAMSRKTNFRWELRGERTLRQEALEGEPLAQIELLLGFAFGVGGPPKDTDADGVPDRRDACPDTPRGARVDGRGCPIDSDGDGVYDGIDQCPDTPKGVKVDAKGCPTDADGDGVFDGIDQCPGTPKGAKVDAKGCPTDADGDGVFDGIDQCPDTPKGTKVDAKGCPVAMPLFEEGKKTLVLEGVNFEYNSAELTAASKAILDRVAASLKEMSTVRVEVAGHTDGRGSASYNRKLSEARAKSVMDYLVSKEVSASQLSAKGYGMSQPIADNKTDEGRAKNRRVELKRLD